MSVTETSQRPDAMSVTPRCQRCGAKLVRKLPRVFGRGTWVQHYRKGARYCTDACRQKAYRQRKATP